MGKGLQNALGEAGGRGFRIVRRVLGEGASEYVGCRVGEGALGH